MHEDPFGYVVEHLPHDILIAQVRELPLQLLKGIHVNLGHIYVRRSDSQGHIDDHSTVQYLLFVQDLALVVPQQFFPPLCGGPLSLAQLCPQ